MKFFLAFLLSWLPIYSVLAASLSVELPNEHIALKYSQPVRLHQVLSDSMIHLKSSSPASFPLANQLFNLDREPEAFSAKLSVLDDLSNLGSTKSLQVSSGILIEQIKRWDIGYREFVPLDLDVVRDQPSLNPLLDGKYELLIPQRENKVLIEGLVYSPKIVDFSSGSTVASVLSQLTTLSVANNSRAWVVYPDGNYHRVGYAYWNDEETSLAPGSVIFLGFDSENSELEALELQIVKLISMRKNI
ncbi:MAG: capsule biosynthesis GfcC family protein [Vibrionaceae bacterium]|nr:capsule biosynthesis GfcC family protein [Vibrionaceae bacterium]